MTYTTIGVNSAKIRIHDKWDRWIHVWSHSIKHVSTQSNMSAGLIITILQVGGAKACFSTWSNMSPLNQTCLHSIKYVSTQSNMSPLSQLATPLQSIKANMYKNMYLLNQTCIHLSHLSCILILALFTPPPPPIHHSTVLVHIGILIHYTRLHHMAN